MLHFIQSNLAILLLTGIYLCITSHTLHLPYTTTIHCMLCCSLFICLLFIRLEWLNKLILFVVLTIHQFKTHLSFIPNAFYSHKSTILAILSSTIWPQVTVQCFIGVALTLPLHHVASWYHLRWMWNQFNYCFHGEPEWPASRKAWKPILKVLLTGWR